MDKKIKAHTVINQLVQDHYRRALSAKENGEMVGWCTSNFPQEIIETMGLTVVYPENHSATLAARQEALPLCGHAEAIGYSNDICSYAKVNLGYLHQVGEQSLHIPRPDYLLCCSNICHQLMKWYENIAQELHIPMIFIDIPFNTDYETDDIRLQYIKTQFYDAIQQLEKITGKVFYEDKFKQVMKISNEVGNAWNKISDYACYQPSPYSGTDLFVYMGAAVCLRGREETRDAFYLLLEELEEAVRVNKSKCRYDQKYRILYEGICCWPALLRIATSMAQYGMNIVGAVYTNTYGIEYNSFDEMIKAYTCVPNAVNFEKALDMRLAEIGKKHCDGALVHMSRSCKVWSGILYELTRKIEEKTGTPTIFFDGDQADPQNFSEAQYDTRIQGFYEVMKG